MSASEALRAMERKAALGGLRVPTDDYMSVAADLIAALPLLADVVEAAEKWTAESKLVYPARLAGALAALASELEREAQ